LVLWLPWAWSQIVIIAAGALIGWDMVSVGSPLAATSSANPVAASGDPTFKSGLPYLITFFLLLALLPWLAHATALPALDIFDRFYRAGALVFGGAHVVLPLLEREVVAPGWLTPDQFLAGYGAAQAMPGPLFTLSAYLGAVINHGPGGVAGAGWALLAIFLPALLLVAGVLPFWQFLRHRPAVQAAMRGANAAVVGLLLAALYHPVGTAGLTSPFTLIVALGGFVALQSGKIPAWAVVIAAAVIGAAFG
jgi:chromate transporter